MRYVAFLRAINISPRNVKMDRLRAVFGSLGFENVATFIASGNVIFDTGADADIVARIEAALEAELGFDVPTFLRTAADVIEVADRHPFSDDGQVEVSFLATEPYPAAARALEATVSGSDRLAVIGREVYWSPIGPGRDSSHTEARVVRILGMPTTRRGLRTIERIADTYLR